MNLITQYGQSGIVGVKVISLILRVDYIIIIYDELLFTIYIDEQLPGNLSIPCSIQDIHRFVTQ